jgi:hypothetical protein
VTFQHKQRFSINPASQALRPLHFKQQSRNASWPELRPPGWTPGFQVTAVESRPLQPRDAESRGTRAKEKDSLSWRNPD